MRGQNYLPEINCRGDYLDSSDIQPIMVPILHLSKPHPTPRDIDEEFVRLVKTTETVLGTMPIA